MLSSLLKPNTKAANGVLIAGGLFLFLCAGVGAQTGQKSASAERGKSSTTHSAKSSSKKKSSKSNASRSKGQLTPTTDRIKEIQSALAKADAYDGEPTGKWDPATIEAMKKFQQANGLTPSGKLNALSLEKLGLGSGTAGRGAPRPAAAVSSQGTSTSLRPR